MADQDTVKRVQFFNHQLLRVEDFTEEQGYHIRMRRTHNRLMHSWGILDGLELVLDPRGQTLIVEEGTALDSNGCEIVLPRQEQPTLAPFAGKTVWVTIAYRERPAAAPGAPGSPAMGGTSAAFSRTEEYPEIAILEAPPADPSVKLVLGRLVVGADGSATLDPGEPPHQRRNAGGAGGDLEGRGLTLSRPGLPVAEWPSLKVVEPRTMQLAGGLHATGDLRADGRAYVLTSLNLGPLDPRGVWAKVQVVNEAQDSNGNTLVLGPEAGSHLRLGYHTDYSWVQSHGGKPLRLNEMGNDVLLAPLGRSHVGVGTDRPARPLHVAGDDAVALLESRGSNALLGLTTREGMENRVEIAARPGGRMALAVSGGGDVVNVTRDGRLGVGTETPTERFHVRSNDTVALLESIGENAVLRLDTREGPEQRVQVANRPGGRMALGTAAAGDVVNLTRDGQVGIGTAQPQGRLHVAGDLVVDGEIRSLRGGQDDHRWTAVKGGLAFAGGAVGVGTSEPQAKLHVLHTPQDSNGDALQVGPDDGSHLRLGYHQEYSWVQSHGNRPLRINELGNDVLLNLGGGNVGVGTVQPQARLHVKGDVFVEGKIRTAAGEVTPGGGAPAAGGAATFDRISFGAQVRQMLNLWNEAYGIGVQSYTQYYRSDRNFAWYKGGAHNDAELNPGGGAAMMVLNDGKLGIGIANPQARLQVAGGALMPAAGNGEAAGILFPPDAGGGAGDRAWMRYYSRGGEAMTLELGVTNDGDDHIALMPSGGVGIGTNAPTARLHVKGDVFVEGAIRTPQGVLTPGGGAPAAGPHFRADLTVTAGPWNLQGGNGHVGASGPGAELSFARRSLAAWPGAPAAGDRYVWYNQDGTARLWTEGVGNLFAVGPQGNVGMGADPRAEKLFVAGDVFVSGKIRTAAGELVPGGGGGAAPAPTPGTVSGDLVAGGPAGERFILHTRTNAKGDFLQIAGDDAGGNWEWAKGITFRRASGNVGIGTTDPQARLQVAGGAIMPSAGNGEGAGILFPPDAGGGGGDRAWMRYYSRGGEAMTLELGITNDGDDHLALMPSGGVGIGTNTPGAKLHVKGDVIVDGNIRTAAGVLTPGGGGGAPAAGPNFRAAQTITAGPIALEGAEGRISATGSIAELSFTKRSLTAWPGAPAAGDRYVWYNQDGTARLWTEAVGNLFAVGPQGNVAMGADPRGEKLFVKGDVFVDGKIRTPAGELIPGGGGGGATLAPWSVVQLERAEFGTKTRQMINLWNTEYGIGIQGNTQYYRTWSNFAWYKGGAHNDAELNPGGGAAMMVLNGAGNLGVGTATPQDRLDVRGPVRLLTDANPLRITSGWTGFPDAVKNQAEISNDTGTYKTLMIVGNKSGDGTTRKVSVWDRLEVNGSLQMVGGPLTPSAGNGEGAGILFPPDAGGGAGDRAWMRYYSRGGEAMTLELGTTNDGDDHIALMPSGGVGIGTNAPTAKLHVKGDVFVEGAIRTPQGVLTPGGGGAPAAGGAATFDRISFGAQVRQMLNLWNEAYGIGVQSYTQYYRSDRNFAWYKGGAHNDAELNPGGGAAMMVLRDGNLGVGAAAPEARLHVLHTPQDSGGNALVLGPTGGANLRMGYAPDYSWIQSHGSKPLRINELGNNVVLNLRGGNVGVGVDNPAQQLTITGGLGFGNQNATDKKLHSPADGLLRWQTHNAAGQHAFEVGHQGDPAAVHLDTAGPSWFTGGAVGIGTNAPSHPFHVRSGDNVALLESTGDHAYIRLANRAGFDKRVELANRPGGRLALWVPGAGDAFSIDLNGAVTIGYDKPVPGVRIRGNVVVEGTIQATGGILPGGPKMGYVADQFVNATGDALEEGDVVVISTTQPTLFYGERGNIPIPEVDLADAAGDRRVCGIVAQVHGFDDEAAGMEPTSTARKKRSQSGGDAAAAPSESDDPRTVGVGQRGAMVTLGAFAHCKVDADIAAIEVGDLLMTSPTKGHAQKVTDHVGAMGAILGKALAPLKKGKGKIPVMVLLQ